jgi:hypothetical protein
MMTIEMFKNSVSGKCVLIGGGCSVDEFDFKSLNKDIQRIAVNRCFVDTRIDFQVFTDPFFLTWINEHPITDDRILIAPFHLGHTRIDALYEYEKHIYEGFSTGYHALQVAQYLGFNEIYLIGFDYYDVCGKLHYYEGEYDTKITKKEKEAINSSFHKWIKDFDKIDWIADIYNCNPDSKLKKFQYKEVN